MVPLMLVCIKPAEHAIDTITIIARPRDSRRASPQADERDRPLAGRWIDSVTVYPVDKSFPGVVDRGKERRKLLDRGRRRVLRPACHASASIATVHAFLQLHHLAGDIRREACTGHALNGSCRVGPSRNRQRAAG